MKQANRHRTAPAYALLIQAREKEHDLSETFIYILLVAAGLLSIWQAALQPLTLRVNSAPASAMTIAHSDAEQAQA